MDNSIHMYNQKPWQAAAFYTNPSEMNYSINSNTNDYVTSNEYQQQAVNRDVAEYVVTIPMSLATSIEGKYFVGSANDLVFGEARHTWARLYNPNDSGVNLHVNVWTVGDVSATPYKVQIWFNSTPSGLIQESDLVTPSNTTLSPLPQPKIKLQYAISVRGFPSGGVRAYGRNGLAGTSINSEEEGKFIFPPGGSFLVFLSNPEMPTQLASGRIAFGWWEEPIL